VTPLTTTRDESNCAAGFVACAVALDTSRLPTGTVLWILIVCAFNDDAFPICRTPPVTLDTDEMLT
jgi:hypothetical protein